MGAPAALAYSLGSGLTTGQNNAKLANTQVSNANQIYASAVNPLAGAMSEQASAAAGEQQQQNAQADLALAEANETAQQEARNTVQTRETQAQGYNSSGVMLQGSPLAVLNQTVQLGQQEIQATMARGNAQANLLRQQAYMTGSTNRAQLIGEQANFLTQNSQARMQALQNARGLQQGNQQALTSAGGNAISLLGNISAKSLNPLFNALDPSGSLSNMLGGGGLSTAPPIAPNYKP